MPRPITRTAPIEAFLAKKHGFVSWKHDHVRADMIVSARNMIVLRADMIVPTGSMTVLRAAMIVLVRDMIVAASDMVVAVWR